VPGSAGNAVAPVTPVHQSLNNTQIAAYPLGVRRGAAGTPAVGWADMAPRPDAGNGVPDQRSVFPGVDLEHPRAAVTGLPHNLVCVRAGPEGLGDEPGAQ
jgi:hypothetical protein